MIGNNLKGEGVFSNFFFNTSYSIDDDNSSFLNITFWTSEFFFKKEKDKSVKFHRRIIYSSFRKLQRRGEKNSSNLDVCLFEGIFSFMIANALYRRIKASYLECTDGHKQHSHCISLVHEEQK